MTEAAPSMATPPARSGGRMAARIVAIIAVVLACALPVWVTVFTIEHGRPPLLSLGPLQEPPAR